MSSAPWLRPGLATFKTPRDIHVVDELPRNAIGKILKADLRRRSAGQAPDGPAAGR